MPPTNSATKPVTTDDKNVSSSDIFSARHDATTSQAKTQHENTILRRLVEEFQKSNKNQSQQIDLLTAHNQELLHKISTWKKAKLENNSEVQQHNVETEVRAHSILCFDTIARTCDNISTTLSDMASSILSSHLYVEKSAEHTENIATYMKMIEHRLNLIDTELRESKSIRTEKSNYIGKRTYELPLHVEQASLQTTLHENNSRKEPSLPTYAQVLSSTGTHMGTFRNILLTGRTSQDRRTTAIDLNTNDDLSQYDITSIKKRDSRNYWVQCKTVERAELLENYLQQKYGEYIKITGTRGSVPSLKITGLNTSTQNPLEIKKKLIERNTCLKNVEFEIVAVYMVNAPKRTYVNAIMECDLKTHTELIKMQKLFYGFAKVQVYEYADIIQCKKCLGYGHLHAPAKATCIAGDAHDIKR